MKLGSDKKQLLYLKTIIYLVELITIIKHIKEALQFLLINFKMSNKIFIINLNFLIKKEKITLTFKVLGNL